MAAKYELVLLFGRDCEKTAREAVFGKITDWFGQAGATVEKKEDMGVKSLVYEIGSKREAAFWRFFVKAQRGLVADSLNTMLNREPLVMRYLLLAQ